MLTWDPSDPCSCPRVPHRGRLGLLGQRLCPLCPEEGLLPARAARGTERHELPKGPLRDHRGPFIQPWLPGCGGGQGPRLPWTLPKRTLDPPPWEVSQAKQRLPLSQGCSQEAPPSPAARGWVERLPSVGHTSAHLFSPPQRDFPQPPPGQTLQPHPLPINPSCGPVRRPVTRVSSPGSWPLSPVPASLGGPPRPGLQCCAPPLSTPLIILSP